ncbi:oxidoreductase [Aureococcus anophagefferens]|nr:oxidoreductase [Aureococcus anophagefferens]
MGKGARAALQIAEKETLIAALIPKEKLPTKKEIRDSIPEHCFQHSYTAAFAHVARDGLIIATFAFLAFACLRRENLTAVDWVGWNCYAFFQGAALTGCALLVPYFAWQYSHAKHHSKTNHLMDGETHNPNSKDDVEQAGYVTLAHAVGEEGFVVFQLFAHLHTSPDVPHYGDDEWTWVRGALCTIDRPYAECLGFFDWVHHHIGSTHVCHHLFSNLPCYHAVEATQHLKAYLKPLNLYNYDHDSLWVSMIKAARTCHYIEEPAGVQYPKPITNLFNKDGKAAPKAAKAD